MGNMLREISFAKAILLIRKLVVCLFLLLSSFLLVSCNSSLLSNANWQPEGFQKQQLRVVEVDSKDPTTLYVANGQGQIFISIDAGQKWSEQSNGLPLPDVVHALSFDASGQKLYAATDKGLFSKAKGAPLWHKISSASLPATPFTALAFLPAN